MAIRKVMLVDDEADIRKVANISLKGVGGWEVALAASGDEAIATARSERPDVILLDVMMPGMDGLATLERLRAEPGLEAVPVIFMTAKVQKNEVDRYLGLGVAGVIAKPFDPMSLPDEIRGILDGA